MQLGTEKTTHNGVVQNTNISISNSSNTQLQELVKIENNQPVTTSIKIAEQFGLRNRNIVSTIERYLKTAYLEVATVSRAVSTASTGTTKKGQVDSYYFLNEKATIKLLSKMRNAKASMVLDRYIDAFLEAKQKPVQASLPNNYIEALKALIIREEDNQRIQLQLSETQKALERKQNVIVDMTVGVPAVQVRSKISQIIRNIKGKPGYYYKNRWDKLYYQFKYRHGVDVPICAINRGLKNIEYVESISRLNDLYLLALDLFEKEKELLD